MLILQMSSYLEESCSCFIQLSTDSAIHTINLMWFQLAYQLLVNLDDWLFCFLVSLEDQLRSDGAFRWRTGILYSHLIELTQSHPPLFGASLNKCSHYMHALRYKHHAWSQVTKVLICYYMAE